MMKTRKAVSHRWRELSITTKFSLTFALLLALIVLVAITSYVALTVVHRQTDTAILTSTEIQRLVLEMEASLEEARRQERDFFRRYPSIGFSKARQMYAQQASKQISEVVALSAELQQLISVSDVSAALRKSDINLNLYLSEASRYATTFGEAVGLVAQLAAPETGLQAQLAQNLASLYVILRATDDPGLRALFHEMQSFEKEYAITRQRPLMQSAFNVAISLNKGIELTPTLEENQKTQALAYLDKYLAIAQEILRLDVAIRSKFNEFDLQAEAVDPISEELIALAGAEVERARDRIDRTSRSATVILVATAVLGLVLAAITANVLNNSITRNVIKLTRAAAKFRSDWETSEILKTPEVGLIQLNRADELGQLAGSFNAMAARINALVGSLEQKVAERTAELTRTNEQLQQEIVERKQAEEELQESEKRFRSLFEDSPISLWEEDFSEVKTYIDSLRDLGIKNVRTYFEDHPEDVARCVTMVKFVDANKAALELYKSKNQDEFKRDLEDVFTEESYDVFKKELIAFVEGKKEFESETVNRTLTGEKIHIVLKLSVAPGYEESMAKVLISIIDITERKQAEEKIQWLAKFPGENPNPVLRVYKDGTIMYTNDASAGLLEFWGCQVNQQLPELWRTLMEKVLEATVSETAEVIYADRTLALTFAPVVGSEFVNVYGLDITERKQAEESIKALNQSLEEMVYIASHDLQTPLVSMQGYASELLEDYKDRLDDNGVYCLTRLRANAQRMHALVLSLLDISRLNTKKYPYESFDPRKLVDNAIHDLSLAIERAEAQIEVEEMPPIYGDRQRIAGVFRNLLSNAIVYGGKHITVGFKDEVYYVKDDGIGIPENQLEKIFTPGERLKFADAEGVGMGLTFCQKVINQHGGKIWAESEGTNKGTTFYFTLKA